MRIIALDLSLTETGWAVHLDGRPVQAGVMKPPRLNSSGTRRLAWFRDQVHAMSQHFDPVLVAVEGYSFGSKGQAVYGIAELGGVVRLALHDLQVPIVVVPPASLKKYATGRGNAKKEEVLVAAVKRLGYHGANNNIADAMWLRQMAADHYGVPDAVQMPKAQRAALEAVEWPQITPEMTAAVAAGGVR